ncbi:MAG: hypothetical protein PHF31_02545 [Methylobacter sp.]|nr:hypothetical protein [Methylobacter sp.]
MGKPHTFPYSGMCMSMTRTRHKGKNGFELQTGWKTWLDKQTINSPRHWRFITEGALMGGHYQRWRQPL